MDDRIRELERAAAQGDLEAEERLLHALARSGDLVARYVRGEREAVWAELVALGSDVREPAVLPQAQAVARETMRRARRNVETLVARLREAGYRFQFPDEVHVPPAEDVEAELDAFEARLGGPLPLSLRAFWGVVGSVNLAQAHDQTVHDWVSPRGGELAWLGDDDPLWVDSLEQAEEDRARHAEGGASRLEDVPDDRLVFCFAPDAIHKAKRRLNYVRPGENYNVWLPAEGADFRIMGWVGEVGDVEVEDWQAAGEWFVENLRATFVGGGFRGRVDVDGARLPPRPLAQRLAAGLTPI
jgi:hypothetical protein